MNEQTYQTVTLVLEDGRRCTYTGTAQIPPTMAGIKVVDILVSEPQPMPPGCSWHTMKRLCEETT